MKVGITGHQEFDDPSVIPWIEKGIHARLCGYSELRGLSSLAKGADQLFARVVLELGGDLEAVLPFAGYAATFENAQDASDFHQLLARCGTVTVLPFAETKEQSYLLAGEYVADHSELLIAVWNGKPAAGLGGTADVVSYALNRGREVYQINPATRTTANPS